ncbi:MAG: ATP-dependent Clp protease proteolytic subunit [Sphaerochaeta sp.]|nr:ATP-dependent Clp protease proteolytic subunit [Sphaerochaeta sp.]
MKKFWNWVRDEDTGERTLYLCGVIAESSWFDDDITPAMFKTDLLSGEGDVTVWINSPGGDCLAASQIYNMLMDYKGNVTVKIDSLAASAASVIAMAGKKVLISPTGLIMIHNPASIAIGDTAEMRKAIQMLDEVKESIINAYEIKTGLSRARLSHLMDGETWMNANMAIELGFADELLFTGKGDDAVPATDPVTAEDGYAYSCRTVSNKLLARIAAKMHKAVDNTTAEPPALTKPPNSPVAEPQPPAPAVPEETVPAVTPASVPAEPRQPAQAGVSVSGLERRLDLLKPYGVKPVTLSTQTAPSGTANT